IVAMVVHTSSSKTAGGPLAETVSRLSSINTYVDYNAGIPEGDRWLRLDSFCDKGFVDALYQEATGKCGDHRAAAHVVGDLLAAAVVHVWLVPVLAEERLPLAAFDGAALHVHEDGWVDAVSVDTGSVAVLPGDPAVGAPGVSVI